MRTVAGILLLGMISSARADLHFPQVEVQRGDLKTGQPLRQRFTFSNQGPGIVRVQRLSAACGCMTPRLEQHLYQAGESGELTLEVNTLTQPAGPNRWRVVVEYSDGEQQRTRSLYVLAVLHSELEITPAKLSLSTTGPIQHEIIVKDRRALPLCVTQALAGSPHLTATVSKSDGHTHRIRLEVKDSLPPGIHEGTLAIHTDDPAYRELRVPVTIVKRAKAGVSAAPSSVNLVVPKGQPASRVVLLRAEEEQAVIVEKIESDNPALTCRWAAGPGKLATLKLSVDGTKVTDTLRGTVRVHVSKPSPATIVIPVACTAR